MNERMMHAADFRRFARETLKGKWLKAVLAGLVAALLGAQTLGTSNFTWNLDLSNARTSLNYSGQTIVDTTIASPERWNPILGVLMLAANLALIAILVIIVLLLVIGSIVEIGYARFNLLLTGYEYPSFEALFSYFPYWKTAIISRLLRMLYTFLWTLLLVIPGIVATYSYSMTRFIQAENPEMSASEAIALSKEMMYGNRWRLFCLHLSFLGWDILCTFTLGIGYLWLNPYKQAAEAAFYREVSGM